MFRIALLFLICAGTPNTLASDLVILHPTDKVQQNFEGSRYVVVCDAPNANQIEWYGPKRQQPITELRTNEIYVERNNKSLQLKFQKLSTKHSGQYTCTATIDGKNSYKTFNLTVMVPISFVDRTRVYYAPVGGNATLLCEVKSSPPAAVSWWFNETQLEGEGYKILADGIFISNITEDKFGNYTCKAFMTSAGVFSTRDVELKLAKLPEILDVYKNNTVYGILNTEVSIKCIVSAEPPADIEWVQKDGGTLKLGDYNATMVVNSNENVLKLNLTSKDFLGEYRCKAVNVLGITIQSFNLSEGESPIPPSSEIREKLDKVLHLDIIQNGTQELNNYRVMYKKIDDSNNSWEIVDFGIRDSKTNPYSVNGLEPNTKYVYKVGACTQVDLCAFTNETTIVTAELATGSATTVHTLMTQICILLPAFLLSFLTQRQPTT